MNQLFAIAVLLLGPGDPPSATACGRECSCAWEHDIVKAKDRAAAVFEAVALDSTHAAPWDSVQGHFRVRLAVGQVWKGDFEDTTSIVTREPRAACGFDFVQGERYLVFAYRTPAGQLGVTMCSPSAGWREATKTRRTLGRPSKRGAA
jgi:hypothetical protein